MATTDELKSFSDTALERAGSRVDAIIARIHRFTGSQIRFSQGSIDIAKRWEEQDLELFVVIDKAKIGLGRVPVSEVEDVKRAVDDTIDFARRLPESMFYGGIEDKVSKYSFPKDTYDKKLDTFADLAPGIVGTSIDAAIQAGAKRVAGALKFSKDFSYMKSSLGPEGNYESSQYDLNVRAFQDALDYSGQGISCGTMPSKDEKSMIDAGSQAGRLSKEAAGARQGEPGTYDVVFSPTVAADVIAYIPNAANPFAVLVGLSPLGDRIGQKIGPDFVTVDDDAHFPGGIASIPFDFEGTPASTTRIIDNGVLKSFIHNTTTAKMSDTKSTGNSAVVGLGQGTSMLLPNNTNVVFDNGDQSVEELLEGSRPTIHVTCNWYTRWQNYQTGDFSTIPRDAMFLVKNGKKTPIKNIRVSDNMLRMFANIMALGNDRRQIVWWEVPQPIVIPSVKVADCRITAATQ